MDKILAAVATIIVVILLVVLLGAVVSFFIMLLWNAVMPDIFGLPIIDYWHAYGLYLLSSILIKSYSTSSK